MEEVLVQARAFSDDGQVEVTFDAAGYIRNASLEQLSKLARCGWGGDYPADEVAHYYAQTITKRLFDYLEIINEGKSKCFVGFECYISKDSALSWLEQNQPGKYVLLKEETEGSE